MGVTGWIVRPFARRVAPPVLAHLDQRLERQSARFEQHTVNLAEHQAQLRDESLRAIVNEVRANSAFLADSVVALRRAEANRANAAHTAMRPIVHAVRAHLRFGEPVILVDHVDPVVVDELVTHGHSVTVVEPAMDFPYPDGVVVAPTPIVTWRGPRRPIELAVWLIRTSPTDAHFASIRRWLAAGGSLVVGSSPSLAVPEGFAREHRYPFIRRPDGYRLVDDGHAPDFVVDCLRAV
jgi:hypothetical protein